MKLPLNVKMPSLRKPTLKMPSFRSLPKADPKTASEGEKSSLLSGRTRLIAGTALAVFGIGFVMQNVFDSPVAQNRSPQKVTQVAGALQVNKVRQTASETPVEMPVLASAGLIPMPAAKPVPMVSDRIEVLADIPADAGEPEPLAIKAPIQTAAYRSTEVDLPGEESVPQLACTIDLDAAAAPAATVNLTISAACLPNERLTLHHNGMMFTAVTDATGTQKLRVPALSQNAVYIVSFANGEGAVAQIDVPTLASYDRVVVQWRGEAGLGLHALEFGAAYFANGHVHSEAAGDVAKMAQGTSGFMMRFGEDVGPEALRAEVYTFPTGMAGKSGEIGLSVEAEVTASNCGAEISAQTLQIHPAKAMRTQDLELFMPECDAIGDFLVLNNLLEDLKVASN